MEDVQADFLSDVTDLECACHFLAELHDELPTRIERFRYMIDLGGSLGPSGTIFFGGQTTWTAYNEARSSFVAGNFIATIFLCQSLMENLLAALLHMNGGQMPSRIQFKETLRLCKANNLVADEEAAELERLVDLRNPLMHFRDVGDSSNLTRRTLSMGKPSEDILYADASVAIGTVIKMLSRPPFRVG